MVIQHAASPALSKDVLYIGSAVPLETSEGLEAVQQPLRSRYPVDNDENVEGILSTLSILPSGIQLRYTNDPSHVVLFPFSALTMCAAVRCVKVINAATNEVSARFVSLSSPEAGGTNSQRPAIFTAITRRTKGRQVLECHGFITMTPNDALELVQWTSTMDKRSKRRGLDILKTGTSMSNYDVSRAADTSFLTETASLPELPVHLVAGESVEPISPSTSPAFYKEPPANGFFYSTKNAQVKKYSLHKFSGIMSGDDTHSSIHAGADHFERTPVYASSHYSTNVAMFPAQPRQPVLVPIHTYPTLPPPLPTYTRPVFVRPGPAPTMFAYPRARFFSPSSMMRVHPVPVLVPQPVSAVYNGKPFPRSNANRQGSRSSTSTSPSSIPESAQQHNGRSHMKSRAHDDTSQSSSRPRTPPTDYEAEFSQGNRVSRKEDFYLHQNVAHESPGFPKNSAVKGYKGYYVVPPYGYYSLPHDPSAVRPHSVPPYMDKHENKSMKKQTKTSKKTKKKTNKKAHQENRHDESTDSIGYTSEFADNNKQPRDFRRMENQFKHERAFSKSLAEETRHSLRGGDAFNAYSLNNTTGNENDFPHAMY